MELYQFDLTDSLGLSEEEIFKLVNFLEEESQIQQWEDGYTVEQWGPREKLPNGDILYRFRVFGEYKPSINTK